MIIEAAERVDAHDHRDHEQDHRALAAVAVGSARAAVQPHARGEDKHRGGEFDHSSKGHRWSILMPKASVAAVATTSSATTTSTITPAVLPMRRKVRARFIAGTARR